MRKKLLIICMAACLFAAPTAAWADTAAYSTGGGITPYYTYVNGVNTIFGISTSGLATCYVSVDENPSKPFDYSKLTVYIKKSSNDATVKNFSATKYPSSGGHFSWTGEHQLTARGSYYMKAVNKLYKNNNLVETITTYSVTDLY